MEASSCFYLGANSVLMVLQSSLFLVPPPQHIWTLEVAVLNSPFVATDAEPVKMCASVSQGARHG